MEQEKRSRVGSALRHKWPELLVEGFSVALAVLLALAVDEWRENRSNRELAELAEASIVAEVQENLRRLEEGAADRDSLLAYLDASLAILESGETPEDISINVSPALLARTAWETAQVTRAIHFMPYDKVARIGRLYDFQRMYETSEAQLVELISSLGSMNWDEPVEPVGTVRTALVRADMLADNLEGAYRASARNGFDRPDPDALSADSTPDEITERDAEDAGTASAAASNDPGASPQEP